MLYAMIAAALLSFVSVDLTDDVKVFLGAAKHANVLAQETHNPLYGLGESWELKPAGNRVLYFAVVALGNLSGIPLDILLKLVAMCTLVVTASIFSFETAIKIFRGSLLDADVVFGLVILSMLLVVNLFFMQAEWWAVILSFLVLSMLMFSARHESYGMAGAAGFVSVFIVLLKMSTLALIPAVFAAYILLNEGWVRREIIVSWIIGFVSGCVSAAIWMVFLIPHGIQDMILSVQLAHAAKGVQIPLADGINYLVYYSVNHSLLAPITMFGMASLLCLLSLLLIIWKYDENLLYNRAEKSAVLLAALWGAPLLSILAQNEFFSYHYVVMIFPAVITIIVLFKEATTQTMRVSGVTISLAVVFCAWVLIGSMWSAQYAQQDEFWKGTEADSLHFQEKYDLTGEVLYLDIASAAYYLDARPACRMVGSLPVERGLLGSDEYWDTVNCIRSYQGKYAIAKHSEGGSGLPSLIRTNFTRVEEGVSWDVYQRTA